MSYRTVTELCNMPYNFLFNLLQESRNPEWVMAVIDLLLEETEVSITIQDQLNISTLTHIEYYNDAQKDVYDKYNIVTREVPDLDENGNKQYIEVNGEKQLVTKTETTKTFVNSRTEYNYPVGNEESKTTVTTTYSNTATVYVDKAKTWCIDFENNVTLSDTTSIGTPVVIKENYGASELAAMTYREVGRHTEVKNNEEVEIINYRTTEKHLDRTSEQIDQRLLTWAVGTVQDKRINYERFLGLWKNDTGKYYQGALFDPNGKEVGYSLPEEQDTLRYPAKDISMEQEQTIDQLIYLLGTHSDTQKQEQLMKYYWNIYTGEDIYEVDIDSIINLFNTSLETIVAGSSLTNYIQAWENDGLWKYETGLSTVHPTGYLSDDGNYYIVYEDGSRGHNNIAYGIATFISSESGTVTHPTFGKGNYNWQSVLQTHGIDVTTLSTGSLVPVDAVRAAYAEILASFESKVDSYLSVHGITLSENQRNALVAVCYQYGNINGFAEAYNSSLNSDGTVSETSIKNNYAPFNYSSTSNDRKYANWYLFTNGVYLDRSGETIEVGGSILEWAKAIHDYMSQNQYYYCLIGGEKKSSKEAHEAQGLSCGLNSSFENSKLPGNPGYRLTCCATYVSWVLEEAGYLEVHTNGARNLSGMLRNMGWTKIDSYNELQPGDIVFMDTDGPNNGDITHVQIYVGNGTWYNAGSTSYIQMLAPYSSNSSGAFIHAYRVPN